MAADERTPKGAQHAQRAANGVPNLHRLPSGQEVGAPLVARLLRLERENAQLREALTSRIVIEQAKGVLAERNALTLDEAFEVLRRAARSNRMRIHVVAAAVVGTCAAGSEAELVSLQVAADRRARDVNGAPDEVA